MNINKLMEICAVAVTIFATSQIIVHVAATYPLVIIVAVIIFVAGGLYRLYRRVRGTHSR